MLAQLAEVQHELAELKLRVHDLQQTVGALQGRSANGSPLDRTEQVLAFTQELFPGDVQIVEIDDPEIADCRYVRVQVTAQGSIEELAARNNDWHRRLCQMKDRVPGRYRLSIRAG